MDRQSICPKLGWLARFEARLTQVHPDIDRTMARMYAECAFVAGADAAPEAVAGSFFGRAELRPLDRPAID